jgi:hypothetical protein
MARSLAMQRITDPSALEDIAKNDKSAGNRAAAVKQLTDPRVLADIAMKEKDRNIARAALDKLDPGPDLLAELARGGGAEARLFAVWRLADRDLLAAIAQKDADPRIRAAAAAMLSGKARRDAGQNLWDLIAQGQVVAEINGQSIQQVSVKLRKTVPWTLMDISIPAGAYFRSANPRAQNMVTRAETRVTLNANSQSFHVLAACANMPKAIPGGNDAFTLTQLPANSELAKLAAALGARTPYPTAQAAVWIVTDNAGYRALGTLVTGPARARTITEEDAARAMRLAAAAGIDIKKKNIWRDRRAILAGLEPGELKTWLEKF